jgi:enoyl-CoA hydratase/carnithine racemase
MTATQQPETSRSVAIEFETILYDVTDRIATITLNRPDVLNAISPLMARELKDAYAAAEADPDAWIIIVTAVGRAFTAGADVSEIPGTGKVIYDEPYLSTHEQWDAPQEATPPFRTMTKPVLAAINGLCVGAGMDLVSTADIVIAADHVEFLDPHVTIGLVSAREAVRYSRVMPFNVAMRMALMGKHERLNAQRLYELGVITELVPSDRLLDRAREIAGIVNQNAPLAVRGTRMAIRKGASLPVYEAELLAETYRERVTRTEDALEGPRAFVEKRSPNWQAR